MGVMYCEDGIFSVDLCNGDERWRLGSREGIGEFDMVLHTPEMGGFSFANWR